MRSENVKNGKQKYGAASVTGGEKDKGEEEIGGMRKVRETKRTGVQGRERG